MFDGLLLGARILLAGVFAIAGAAKIVDRQGTRTAVAAFGVPERLVVPIATSLPVVELAVAGLVTGASTARAGATLALALLLLASAAVAWALAHGLALECNCFGQLRTAAISRWTLARNGALATLAAFVLGAGPGAAAGLWSIVPAAAVLATLALAARPRVIGLGLPLGATLPDITLHDLAGRRVALRDLIRGETVLLFWRPGCQPCHPLRQEILAWERDSSPRAPTLVVLSLGTASDAAPEGFHSRVLLDTESAASSALRAPQPPVAVRVDARGRIASRLATTAEAVLDLLHG
jgi:hypothetical protein